MIKQSGPPRKLLFICSRNRIRSLTAERLFDGDDRYQVRSAGTSAEARVRVTEGHIGWADIIFVMEKRHRDLMRARFPDAMTGKRVVILDIPDEYTYMDDALLDLLEGLLSNHIAFSTDA